MNTKEFRAALFADIVAWGAAAFPAMPLIFENGPVPDENSIGQIWLDCEVRWYGAKNVSMGVTPRGRHSGAVSTQVFYRQAAGTGQADDVVDSLETLLKNKRLGAGQLQFPQRTAPTHLKGWYKTGLLTPFYLDRD
jgi:hypothetical protein